MRQPNAFADLARVYVSGLGDNSGDTNEKKVSHGGCGKPCGKSPGQNGTAEIIKALLEGAKHATREHETWDKAEVDLAFRRLFIVEGFEPITDEQEDRLDAAVSFRSMARFRSVMDSVYAEIKERRTA